MNKLLLFDIDGTLLARGSGQKEAFVAAFLKVHGVYAAIEMIKYQGKTDQQIAREVLLRVGIDQEIIDAKMAEFMAVMCDYFAAV